ncbi:MAG: coproporphyrinogen III oxidase [Gemmatimonadetes bacterium]|nr:MAG: coproporphyrinogen III oxidase [Gemmatimonadota bacterium]
MRHLYLHVPFCVRRCSYCDFSIAVRKRIPAQEYVEAVLQEVTLRGLTDPGPEPGETEAHGLETLYLGGGTPSLLPPDALATLVTSLRDAFGATSSRDAVEVTVEANPEDVEPEHARAWRSAGVNRVSLGAQSFDDHVLAWMHRSHDAARIGGAVRTLRDAGFDNLSLDLIFALPAELQRDWERDLELALSLGPDHLSLYGLTVEERTPLARWISRGAVVAPEEDRYAEEYLLAHARLAACGYRFYEVSNACRDGFRSRHNSAYWSGRAYVGLGPAAHSYDGRARRWNIPAWPAYARAIAAGRSPVECEEILTPEQRELERLYLALRTDAGLPVTALDRPRPPSTARWIEHGWAEVNAGRLVCTPQGWLRLDALVGDLTSTDAMV